VAAAASLQCVRVTPVQEMDLPSQQLLRYLSQTECRAKISN